MTVGENNEAKMKEEAKKIVDDNLLILLEENRKIEKEDVKESPQLSASCGEDNPIYFRFVGLLSATQFFDSLIFCRKVIFSPDVPIRLDYNGKRVDLTHGPIHGLLMGLATLNCSELRLKRISHRHGLLGFEKLLTFLFKEWISDIKKNQIPSLLGGVGPMFCLVQLCK